MTNINYTSWCISLCIIVLIIISFIMRKEKAWMYILAIIFFSFRFLPDYHDYRVEVLGTPEEIKSTKRALSYWGSSVGYNNLHKETRKCHYDCIITFTNNLEERRKRVHGTTKWDGKTPRPVPVYIDVYTNNEVVINHEFGHFLGFGHSTNPDSIMYPSEYNTTRKLEEFIEFR